MKKISIVNIIIGVLLILFGVVPPLISALSVPKNAASIGIIGGADGPSSNFLTFTLWMNSIYGVLAILGVVILIVGVVLLIISKFKEKD